MRYDTPVFFVNEGSKVYDPDTGEWNTSGSAEVKRWANVTDMGAARQQEVFGDVKSSRLVVRLLHSYTAAYDHVRIGTESYYTDTEHLPDDKHSLVVMRDV